ncbi:uncharacterized protein F4812DRAFT_356153 [Daldinia caldariorum]|uniref:uncharacterized protein n=1 Tax=Daldinia caldariorum TaxID=326644 RepID=UPI0020073F51|nr:uncharacterized protein F4812DRAFT_356153 [Daldinia caldariorum]KAI1469041.1 hypothetical protein F4812DRAFT_356153 [Daldinia caldariorum]
MAPPKNQAKPGKAAPGHTKKPTATAPIRPVVLPAIPLPMIPKQSSKSNKRVPNASSSNGIPASSLEAALVDHADHAPVNGKVSQSAKTSGDQVNGTNVEKPEHATNSVSLSNGLHNGDTKGSNAALPVNGVNGANGVHHVDDVDGISNDSSYAPISATFAPDAESIAGSRSVSASVSASANGNTNNQGAHDAPGHVSQPQSATSPTNPPDQQLPFHHLPKHPSTHHPLQNQLSTDQLPDPTKLRGPPHLHRYQHHPHMSNGGGVIFGGFAGSHNSSPGPPLNGFMPPPGPVDGENHIRPQPNGRHHHAPSGSNGFPGTINTQFRPDMVPASGIDNYGQVPAPIPHPVFDPFSPTVGRFGISTPHSLHGSHASGEPNGVENGAVPPYHPNGMPFGSHAHHEPPVGHPHPAPHFPPFMPPEAFARHLIDEGLRDSIMYFQDQFDSGELTDCVLELVSVKGLHHPVKITGHKLILARSPALKHHIMAARATDLGSHTITVESDDPYLRSDAWWSAVRRLYLFPLLNPAIMGDGASGLHFADGNADRFEFCLGYAAAGHLLQMRDVFIRGLQMTADFITWDTVEEALGFVFEGTIQRHVNYDNDQDVELDFGYGPDARFLLQATINFLVNAFPPNFELDHSVADPPKLARIPPTPAGAASHTAGMPPTIARGTNMHGAMKPNRLSSIKFGDLPAALPEDGGPLLRSPSKCSPVLSRILLNLPFQELRVVLTSESDGASGWNTAQDRYHAVADVVAEREARRVRAVEAIRLGLVPNYQEIQQRLSAKRRYAIVEPWDVLNWQEEVVQPRGAEVPQIVRRWVPQFSDVSGMAQQQLPPQQFSVPDSMV